MSRAWLRLLGRQWLFCPLPTEILLCQVSCMQHVCMALLREAAAAGSTRAEEGRAAALASASAAIQQAR